MEYKTFSILIKEYKKIAKVNSSFRDSLSFDRECGIDYIGLDLEKEGSFLFIITDDRKFFLAKIKYGF